MSARRTPTVLVTGASTGIGRTSAIHLAGLGFSVLAGVRRPADAAAVAGKHPAITPIDIDVTDPASIAAAAALVSAGGSGLFGLVNNAGIAVAGPLELLPPDDLRLQLEVNVIGQLAVTQAMVPMLRQSGGRIVNIGSVSGRIALPMLGPYAASKFALRALSDALRVELAGSAISVALVEPAGIATPIWEKSAAAVAARFAAADPDVLARYSGFLEQAGAHAAQSADRGVPALRVAQAIGRALTARRPRARYVVGRSAWIGAALGHLPARWRDQVLLRGSQ